MGCAKLVARGARRPPRPRPVGDPTLARAPRASVTGYRDQLYTMLHAHKPVSVFGWFCGTVIFLLSDLVRCLNSCFTGPPANSFDHEHR